MRKREVDEGILNELEVLAMNEQEIREALEEWEKISVSPENRYAYEMQLKWLRDQLSNIRGERRAGMEEGLKQGLEQGMKQKERELIRKMMAKGMSITEIAHMLDLAEEEIHKILKD
ncbi:Rpn family recombination-promoting nuclease/putative transposase [Aeribacillus composti]|uniref:Rpn family recombination-promoting nuclease/putative transposase n=1 Tax=Aeribacillus composti TaxID=1868734 RepID=UPI002E1D8850|nr:Rpn family recombination-promoting nuclease/putative transposase [Aeribacillus composti]MED0746278.1 Rpn family recombination-promoting nuclease/putative transposase [Aeribacillus composti]